MVVDGDYELHVEGCAARYRETPAADGPASQAALVAVAFAQAQLGNPYVWGGDGDAEG